MSKLIIEEKPLIVLPQLAVKIGLNEAIILQQLHYWLKDKGHEKDGDKWIYNTYEEWQTQFPFWSISTIRRAIDSLEKQNLIETTTRFNKAKFDKTKWYRINRDTLQLLTPPTAQNEQTTAQNEQTTVQNEQTKTVQNEQIEDSKMNRPIPEITQRKPESTTERKRERRPGGGLRDVQLFFIEKGIDSPLENAFKFFHHYEANGWVQGNRAKPLKDWHSAVFSSWGFVRNNSNLTVCGIDQYGVNHPKSGSREKVLQALIEDRVRIINDCYFECDVVVKPREEEPAGKPEQTPEEILADIKESLGVS